MLSFGVLLRNLIQLDHSQAILVELIEISLQQESLLDQILSEHALVDLTTTSELHQHLRLLSNKLRHILRVRLYFI